MASNAVHTSGSSGTNVRCTGIACFLCWAGIEPDISKIATEIRITLMLGLLQPYFGIATLLRALFKRSHKRPGLARAGSRKQDVNTNSDAQPRTGVTSRRIRSEGGGGEPDFELTQADIFLAGDEVGLGRDVFTSGGTQLVQVFLGVALVGGVEVKHLGIVRTGFHQDLYARDEEALLPIVVRHHPGRGALSCLADMDVDAWVI